MDIEISPENKRDKMILDICREAKRSGIEYRDKFRSTWEEIESQLRCVHPASWDLKESWQTKVYVPLQSKKSEIATSYLNKMVFPRTTSFDIKGIEAEDKDQAKDLVKLINVLMGDGFAFQNTFVMMEGIDIGTGFIKMLKTEKKVISYTFRSAYTCFFDPKCGQDFSRARFWGDQYKKDLAFIREEYNKDKSLYRKETLKELFDEAQKEASDKPSGTKISSDKAPDGFITVRSIDGTTDVSVPSAYKELDLDEFWIEIPNDKGIYEKRVVTIINDKYILRDDENPYGFIPAQWLRIKPRKYDSYGLGYMEKQRGLQDLANSCINLGFDSLKIASMDIIVVDMTKVKEPSTIKYKPLAVWKMKDINGVKINRQAVSSINDILTGLTLIDQIDQDASGITRNIQSTPELNGSGSGSETLGEFERKLQLIDQRFLDVGRFIEKDYLLNVIRKVYEIIINPALFSQSEVDDILGMDEADDIKIENGVATVVGKIKVPKLKITDIRGKDWTKNFKAIGITQFTEKIDTTNTLRQTIGDALKDPALTALTKIEELWKRLLSLSDIEDYEEVLRSKEEIQELMMQAQTGGVPQGQPTQQNQQPTQGVV